MAETDVPVAEGAAAAGDDGSARGAEGIMGGIDIAAAGPVGAGEIRVALKQGSEKEIKDVPGDCPGDGRTVGWTSMKDLDFWAYWKIWACLWISRRMLRRAGRHMDAANRLAEMGAAWGEKAERIIDVVRALEWAPGDEGTGEEGDGCGPW